VNPRNESSFSTLGSCSLTLSPYITYSNTNLSHVRWVPYHQVMTRPQVVDGGEDLQIWKASANVLNKQPRTADKGQSFSLGVGRGG
jgi:hypothetical protein